MKREAMGVLLALAAAACGGSDQSGGTTDFEGVLAANNQSGTVTLTVATVVASVRGADLARSPAITSHVMAPEATTVNVTGTVKIKGGASASLSGTFDTGAKSLTATGGGYTFSGTFAAGRLSGTYTGPAGGGVYAAFPGGSSAVKLYCGSIAGDADGVWNLASHGNDLRGAYYVADAAGGELGGTLTGTSVALTFTGGSANGTLSGSAMSGSWSTVSGDVGSWTGNSAQCP